MDLYSYETSCKPCFHKELVFIIFIADLYCTNNTGIYSFYLIFTICFAVERQRW